MMMMGLMSLKAPVVRVGMKRDQKILCGLQTAETAEASEKWAALFELEQSTMIDSNLGS